MAEPLYVKGITVSSPQQGSCSPCNMIIAVTLNGTVFAWVADGSSAGNKLWSRQGTGSNTHGGNALWYDDCTGLTSGPVRRYDTLPFEGILSTPVIDASGTTPVMFLTSWCTTTTNDANAGHRQWWLHEIDLTTGLDVMVGSTAQKKRMHTDFPGFFDGYQNQRAALLEVRNSSASPYDHLIYLTFGTGVSESNFDQDYEGWLAAYTTDSSYNLTKVFAYSNQPSPCGTNGGGLNSGGATNGTCTSNSGSPPCDCYVNRAYPSILPTTNAPNWSGHGGGCWMSGNGPAATAANALNSDAAVHVFLGCGNGGFQNSGLGGVASDNFGQSLMDFRLKHSGYDSDSTGPFQTFTPYSPAYGVGPALPNACGCSGSPSPTGCSACSYTVQTMNAWDHDQAASGVLLFNDLAATPRMLTIDKAGYGYLLTQGDLCGTGTGGCTGFASGDPGSWTFGAPKTLCTGADSTCDRVTSLAYFNNQNTGSSGPIGAHVYFWPNSNSPGERLTALKLSDNSTAQSGTGNLTWSSGSPKTMSLVGSCTADQNCLGDQIVPGDTLALTGTGCGCVGTCPTVTSVTDIGSHQLTLNVTVATAFGSCTPGSSGQGFTYTGWLVTPAHNINPTPPTTGYPGGALTISAHYDSSVGYYTGAVVWAIVPNSDSQQSNMHRGLGSLYAFGALPTSTDQLSLDWSSADTWCSSSFARPTIVNGSVFVPTYAFSNGTFTTTCPLPGATTPAPSGILVYHL
jgi:hypothetical protein